MAAAISNLGASATSAKRPLEEQLAVLGMLQATMAGSEAGTHYRAFIKSAAEAGQQLGISFVDARNNLLPVTEILERIKGKYGETVDAVEKMELQKAFGRIEAMAAVDLLLPQIGALTSNIDMLGVAMQGGTATTLRMAESMNRDLGASFTLLKQRVHNAFEVLGKSILPLVTPMIQAASQAALAFQQWGEAHPGLVMLGMGVMLVGGAVLSVLGGLALAGGMLQLGMGGHHRSGGVAGDWDGGEPDLHDSIGRFGGRAVGDDGVAAADNRSCWTALSGMEDKLPWHQRYGNSCLDGAEGSVWLIDDDNHRSLECNQACIQRVDLCPIRLVYVMERRTNRR